MVWLLEHTQKFPKHQRFVMAKRMEEAGLAFHDDLVYATKTQPQRKRDALLDADFHLEQLNRLAVKLKLHSFAQYEFLAASLDELGRLLGGWLKSLKDPPGAPGR